MDIQVNNHTLLSDIRKAFKSQFPFLDIAFFSNPHAEGTGNLKKNQLPYDLTTGEAGDPHRIGELLITGNQTVADVEAHFETEFGLHAQVLRKSGSIYLQTTVSDNLSLHQLNQDAQSAAAEIPQRPEAEDYHEQE